MTVGSRQFAVPSGLDNHILLKNKKKQCFYILNITSLLILAIVI
jgi:hypothetical protein